MADWFTPPFWKKYYKNYDVRMTSLMTIGSPFNFDETNLKYKTQMLSDFIRARKNIPKDLTVYSVAGTEKLRFGTAWFR